MGDHIDELLSAYMDNELTEIERRNVEEHLIRCPECAELLNDFRSLQNQVFTTFQSIRSPEGLEDKVMEAISPDTRDSLVKRRFCLFLVPILCAASILAIAVILTGSFLYRFGSVMFKVIANLIYAFSSLVMYDPYVITGLIGFSLLLIIGSSFSLKLLLKTKVVQGD